MLTPIQEQTARFTTLEEHHVKALMLLGVVDKYTTEADMKYLSFAVTHDAQVRLMRNVIDAEDVHGGDTYDNSTILDAVEAMDSEERAALRARLA